MDIFDGRIVVSADDFEEVAYGIEQITAIFEEDINDVIGVLRCSRIEIESDAPPELNAQAETMLSITSLRISNTMMRTVTGVT